LIHRFLFHCRYNPNGLFMST